MSNLDCPYCKKPIQVEDYARNNATGNGPPVVAKTSCCGAGVLLGKVVTLTVQPYFGPKTEDDWALPFTPHKPWIES